MKVGTDGCLLGAWADAESPKRILDIGAGTGLISLMLAQRFPQAHIEGVEIEKECANQALENVNSSPWSERIVVQHSSIQSFEPEMPFDFIVSNPPFFTKAFAAPDAKRHTARHDDTLPAQELIHHATRLLSKNGVFCLIIPSDRLAEFNTIAREIGFFLTEKVSVKPTPNKPPKRYLLKYRPIECLLSETEMVVEESRGVYSAAFTKLLQDFYLYL